MENNKTRKIVMTAMFAALCCVATMIIKIPSPLKGYLNLGDCIVLLSGFMLSPLYGFLAAGIGSALADAIIEGRGGEQLTDAPVEEATEATDAE